MPNSPTMMGDEERKALELVLEEVREAFANLPTINLGPSDDTEACLAAVDRVTRLLLQAQAVGLNDEARSQLGFEVVRIIQSRARSALVLRKIKSGG